MKKIKVVFQGDVTEIDRYAFENLELKTDKEASKYKENRANQHYSKKRGINVKEAKND